LIGLYIDFSSIGCHPTPSPPIAIDHLVLVLYLHSDIEVDNFLAKVPVDKKVFGLDVPVSDAELVKIRDALDEAPADLRDLLLGERPTTTIVSGMTRATRQCVRTSLESI